MASQTVTKRQWVRVYDGHGNPLYLDMGTCDFPIFESIGDDLMPKMNHFAIIDDFKNNKQEA